MSPEMRLMVSPAATYAALARLPDRRHAVTALRRPLVVALVLGASTAISATGHVTPALLLSTTLCWSLVVVLQVVIALLFIAGPARPGVGVGRALDLFFASHAPWSLWLLGAAAWAPSPVGRPLWPLLIVVLVPFALTPLLIAAFFREVLGMDRRRAVGRTLAHQAITWTSLVLLFGAAVQLWPRILQWIA